MKVLGGGDIVFADLLYLEAMLNSWNENSDPVELCLSLYCDAPSREVLEKLQEPGLKITYRDSSMSIMEHVKLLLDENESDNWCFTELTSLWHPLRNQIFEMALAKLRSESDLQVPVIVSGTANATGALTKPLNYDEAKANPKTTVHQIDEGEMGRFWSYIIPDAYLREFVNSAPPQLLSHYYSDKSLVKFIHSRGEVAHIKLASNADNWCYFTRNTGIAMGGDVLTELQNYFNSESGRYKDLIEFIFAESIDENDATDFLLGTLRNYIKSGQQKVVKKLIGKITKKGTAKLLIKGYTS